MWNVLYIMSKAKETLLCDRPTVLTFDSWHYVSSFTPEQRCVAKLLDKVLHYISNCKEKHQKCLLNLRLMTACSVDNASSTSAILL